jgi:hypothetical protein
VAGKEPGEAGYPSARDLPTVVELLRQIRGMKRLTRFVARRQRAKLLELEAQVGALTATVDNFYSVLGARQWIFHEDLNVERVKVATTLRLLTQRKQREASSRFTEMQIHSAS